ncbi:MAG TPA: hypothetical protein VK061_03825 [Bacillota bacterium]|nr:hypothetical protein [Bacillota bacterium]
MSWKSIEMQVALPRTQDVGKYQEQLSKQNQRFQESLAQSQLRQQQLERTRPNRFEKTKQQKVKDDSEDNLSNKKRNDDEQQQTDEQTFNKQLQHPYLGKQVDITR